MEKCYYKTFFYHTALKAKYFPLLNFNNNLIKKLLKLEKKIFKIHNKLGFIFNKTLIYYKIKFQEDTY